MEQKIANDRFLTLSRVYLNNWHYITKRTLPFNDEINFFTGHSGNSKSTVIDAMQIVLYTSTDGQGFSDKAATDDSDRSLIEYLRGMVNIGDSNEFFYLRNQNFSSTTMLELKRSDMGQCHCVRIAFNVGITTNGISRHFFWHKGPMWDNGYRDRKRTMSIVEIEDYLQANYNREEYFLAPHDERFRRVLYDSCLGGLDSEKFPLFFKRAVLLRMNIELEDFVKEYIYMGQDIRIKDIQESAMRYGCMRKKIEGTCTEIQSLRQIEDRFQSYADKGQQLKKSSYLVQKLEILQLQSEVRTLAHEAKLTGRDLEKQIQVRSSVDEQIGELTRQSDKLLRRIASTGYEEFKNQLRSLNELLEQLGKSEARWQQATDALKHWEEEDITPNQTLWDIKESEDHTVDLETLERLKRSMASMRSDTRKQHQEALSAPREFKKQEKQTRNELERLRSGSKAYPKYLENAQSYIQRRLLEETGKSTDVHVLADLLDVKRDEWHSTMESYLGNNKLNLAVAPKYAKATLEVYRGLDKKEYLNVAVLGTKKASQNQPQVQKGTLLEGVTVRESYLRPYMDLLLGRVIKCDTINKLRECRIGITDDCTLYRTFRLQHINPSNYTKFAYIGKDNVRRRIHLLEQELAALDERKKPLEETVGEAHRILAPPWLSAEPPRYVDWLKDINSYKAKEHERKKLTQKLELLREQNMDQLERDRQTVTTLCDDKKRERDSPNVLIRDKERKIEEYWNKSIDGQSVLTSKGRELTQDPDYDNKLTAYLSSRDTVCYDRKKETYTVRCSKLSEAREAAFQELLTVGTSYTRIYPNHNFPVNARNDAVYDHLLSALRCGNPEECRQKATEQTKSAVEHFRDDFMYKIRSAIREVLVRKDELNHIISRLDLGKDKHRLIIGRNKGPDDRFCSIFVGGSLGINSADLNYSYENRVDPFTIEYEKQYGGLMNKLISIFILPENAVPDQMDEVWWNMDKYSDYRTYLFFDMQQLIQNQGEVIKIRPNKMIKKNSGGEGQNPPYVALLASLAQAYRISLPPKVERNPTIRLIILGEVFSRMDGEKVASYIELIRRLKFRTIISATSDKIQNYVENVDKTFVFADPNKESISIQEFERERFIELMQGEEDKNEFADT